MQKSYNTLQELIEHSPNLDYVNILEVNENICNVLQVQEDMISNLKLLEGGYTNPVFTFIVDGLTYVYRYPGKGSEKFINRMSEYKAHTIAKDLALDPSLIWISKEGHKISNFIKDYRYFDYNKQDDIKMVMQLLRSLHNSDHLCGVKYDVYADILNFWSSDKAYALSIYPDLSNYLEVITKIYNSLNYEDIALSLCHNDVYTTNILINDDATYLIDWEFAKDTHPALDLATFFVCSSYSFDEIKTITLQYLENDESLINEYFSYYCVGAFYWLLWALHVEKNGGDTEGFVQNYYKYLNIFLEKVDFNE